MRGMRSLLGLGMASAMMIYAVPRLEAGGGWTAPTIFAVAWIAVALIIIAAHLHELLGVNEEERRETARIHRLRKWKTEQWLARKIRQRSMKSR